MSSFYFTLYVSVIFYFLCLFSIQARFKSGKGRHPSEGFRLENGLGLFVLLISGKLFSLAQDSKCTKSLTE